MPRTDRRRRDGVASLTLMALGSTGAAAALALRLDALLTAGGGRAVGHLPVERVVEAGALAVGLLAAAWLTLSAAVGLGYVVATRRGRRWRTGEAVLERVAPAVVRRLARTAVGVGVGTGLALAPTAALAADHAPDHGTGDSTPAAVLDLGWQPTGDGPESPDDGAPLPEDDAADPGQDAAAAEITPAPADRAAPDSPVRDRSPDDERAAALVTTVAHGQDHGGPGDEDTRVVLRGDTLWGIATERLAARGAMAPSDAEILREMTRWHDANRAVVGADPDVILPGQVLHVPG